MNSALSVPAFSPRALRLCSLVWVVLCLLLGTASTRGQAQTSTATNGNYAQAIITAKALTAENSWAQARDAYQAVLAMAPDAEAKRWCALWLAEAEWRAEPAPDWEAKQARRKLHEDAFARLLEPYGKGQARDGYWRAVLEARARFRGEDRWAFTDTAWQDWLAVADWLAEQPRSEAARGEYFAFLHVQAGRIEQGTQYGDAVRERLIRHFAQAREAAGNAEERAWASWQLARFVGGDAKRVLAERKRCWDDALAAARGQSIELTVRVQELLWRIRLCTGEKPAETGNPDYVGWESEIEELRRLGELSPRAEDHECAKAMLALRALWSQPRLELPIPQALAVGQALRLSYGTCGVQRIEIAVYRHRRERIEAEVKRTDGQADADWDTALERARELVLRKTVELAAGPSLAWRRGEIALSETLSPGIYTVETNGITAKGSIQRSETLLVGALRAAAFDVAEGRHDLFLFDGTADRPVANTEVRGVALAEKGETAVLAGWTDAEGRFSLPLAPRGDVWRGWMVAAFVGGRPLLCRVASGRLQEESERLVADLFLDRPIYRPGETVRWKLILRERRDGRFVLPRLAHALVLNAGNDDTVLAEKQPLVLDAFGTASGEWTIPASARPGYFRMALGWAGDSETDLSRRDWLGFRVDNFVAPQVAGRVELASGAESLQPGRELVFEVGADYLSGGPVVGATVACTFECRNSMEADWQRTENEDAPWQEWADAMRKKTLTGTTGADGKARLTVQLPADLPDGVSCTLEGKVMPTGLPEVEVRSGLWIARGGLYVLPTGTEYSGLRVAETGEKVAFPLAVKDGLQRPVAFVGTAVLVERRWSELWRSPDGRIVDETRIGAERRSLKLDWGDSMPAGWRQLHAGYRENAVAEAAVRADAAGTIVPEFRMPRSGLFGVRLKSGAGELPVLGSELLCSTVLVPDPKMAVPALPPSLAVFALPSRVSREGKFAALAVLPEGVGVGWLALQGENEAKCLRFATRQRAAWVRAERLPRPGSKLGLEMVYQRENGLERERCWYDLPDPALRMEVQLEPVAAVARPGETTSLRVRAKSVAQPDQPVAVAVAAWDEAFTQLSGWTDTESLFLSRFAPVHEAGAEIVGDSGGYRNISTADPRLVVSALADLAKIGAALRVFPDSVGGDEEVVILSPFEVSCSDDTGYCATDTLAGTRIRTELREAAPPMVAAGVRAKPEIEVRRHFSATAFWTPQVVTDAKGEVTVNFSYPDNLTQWRIEAYAVGADGNSFGTATAFARTSLPFQARLNLPRFLVAGDRAEVGATLVNRTDATLTARAELAVDGAVVAATERSQQAATLQVDAVPVAAQGETRNSWEVRAEKAGTAEFTLKAWTDAERDGMALKLPVLEDGILQETAASGRLARSAAARTLTLELPEPLDPARTTARVQLTGSHAAALLDALPYLVDYPYGCVEQTMSRFLPAVVARKTLGELGFDAAAVEARILGKETPADTARRAKTAGLGRLDEVIAKSLARLGEAQRSDGGFGWWPGSQYTDLWMTAYVAWGLELARGAGVAVPERMAERARTAILHLRPSGNESMDSVAWVLASLTAGPLDESEAKRLREGFAGCLAERAKLSAAGRACLALAAAKLGTAEERGVVLRNLENGAERAASDDLGDTVHWGSTSGYWRASDGAVETTALTLLALLELEPKHELIEPAMNWLVLDRRSGRWQSTRDTALAVLALAKFIQVRGEAQGETEVAVLANGAEVGRAKLDRAALLAGAAVVELPVAALRGGRNSIELRRVAGDGPAYAVALAESWAAGETVKPAGHQAAVDRGFVRQKATPTLVGTLRIEPEALPSGGAAVAGEEVQAVVTVTVPNELEYVMVEVPKPAGCEPLNALSGWDARIRRTEGGERTTEGGRQTTDDREQRTEGGVSVQADGAGRAIYREERDDKSVFFLDRLAAGTWEIRFGMRAVTAGDFRALPVQVEAMYVPEIRANSDAQRVRIEPRE